MADIKSESLAGLRRNSHDKIAEEMSALPSMSKREVNIALGQLDRVTDELKRAIEQMDAIYNNHTKEEALT